MELRPQFAEFLQDIRPSERNREEWKRGSNTLRTRLMADAELSPMIAATFLVGVRRSTAVTDRRQALGCGCGDRHDH